MKNTTANIGIAILLVMLAARVYTIDRTTERITTPVSALIDLKNETRQQIMTLANFNPILPIQTSTVKIATPTKIKKSKRLVKNQPKSAVAQDNIKVDAKLVTESAVTDTVVTAEVLEEAFPLDAGNTLNSGLSLHFPRNRIRERGK